ncbi:MAG: hypothetical protein KTR31_06705 [Myxococcales bacterium]|nr:hypothetical protein [Myxococcales bacterium]
MRLVLSLTLFTGCAAEGVHPPFDPPRSATQSPTTVESTDTTSEAEVPESACGSVHYVDMTLMGVVLDVDHEPAVDVDVWLEERNWSPHTVHGEGTTDDEGRFYFDIEQVPIVEECWGIGPQFFLAADDGSSGGEIPANMHIVWAWLDGTYEADISGLPCVLE